MTFFESEVRRIKKSVYARQWQLDTVIATRHYIANHFDRDLSLDLLSRLLFTSKFHLLRLFRHYYGLTPKQYLLDLRLSRARQLLRDGMNVSETCFACGFESPGSFSTFFRSRTGVSPLAFQKKQFLQSLPAALVASSADIKKQPR